MKSQLVKVAVAVVALLILAALVGTQSGTPVEIKSVDNYAGNSNVYTNASNTTITVVELDADKKPVRSWTGTTDSDGKLTIPAGHNLSKEYLRAYKASTMAEFVTPSKLEAGMPFTFAAMGTVEGTVVQVHTLEGEVVATKRTDEVGRVAMLLGLPAGAYIVSATSQGSASLGNINVAPNSGGVATERQPLRINSQGLASATNIGQPIRLTGTGINPDASMLRTWAETEGAAPTPNELTVLASSPKEVVIDAPAKSCTPGAMQILVQDLQTGETDASKPFIGYTASAKLTQQTVMSGATTALIVEVKPAGFDAAVHAHIVSGPVSFPNGTSDMTLPVENGKATFPIHTREGETGGMQVAWSMVPSASASVPANSEIWFSPMPDTPNQVANQDKKEKHLKKAEEAEKEADKAEKAAAAAAEKGDHKKAAEEAKKAADKRTEAAAHRRAAGDTTGAAEQERRAAADSRDEANAHDAQGGNQKPGNDARKRAAEAEQRAASDETRQAAEDAKTDKGKAAGAMDRAADAHERAAKDYRAAGEASKARNAERAAEGARQQAERLRK